MRAELRDARLAWLHACTRFEAVSALAVPLVRWCEDQSMVAEEEEEQ